MPDSGLGKLGIASGPMVAGQQVRESRMQTVSLNGLYIVAVFRIPYCVIRHRGVLKSLL